MFRFLAIPSYLHLIAIILLLQFPPSTPASSSTHPIVNLHKRAGGPGYTPIAPPCLVTYPLTTPHTPSHHSQSFFPKVDLTNQVYHWDLPGHESTDNYTTLWRHCIEQCNYLREAVLNIIPATAASTPTMSSSSTSLTVTQSSATISIASSSSSSLRASAEERTCKSAFLAYNIPNEPDYLPAGTFYGWGCRMYNVTLNRSNLIHIDDGKYVQAIAGNIERCSQR